MISDEMDKREDEEEVGNIGNENECVGNECEKKDGNFENIKAETDNWNGDG
jgi:hypothetical protein